MKKITFAVFGSFCSVIGVVGIILAVMGQCIASIITFSCVVLFLIFWGITALIKRKRPSPPPIESFIPESFTPTEQDWVSEVSESNSENVSYSVSSHGQVWLITPYPEFDIVKGQIKIEQTSTPLIFPCVFREFPDVRIVGLNEYAITQKEIYSCAVTVAYSGYYGVYNCFIKGKILNPGSDTPA